jgi:hypothetical protein
VEHGSGKLYPLAPIPNPGPQKQRPQMLLHGTRTNVQLRCDFLVAATLHQQSQNLFIALRNLDFAEINHSTLAFFPADWLVLIPTERGRFTRSNLFAKASLDRTKGQALIDAEG